MKILSVMTVCMFTMIALSAQEKFEMNTIFTRDMALGGFFAPTLAVGKINGQDGIFSGGKAALIINHRYLIGGGGCGLVSPVEVQDIDTTKYLNLGYGGLELGYIIAPSQMVHITVSSLFGFGGFGYRNRYFEDFDDEIGNEYEYRDFGKDVFYIVEPTVNLELNLVKFMRLGIGASYRYINGYKTAEPIIGGLDGLSINLALSFGIF